MKYPIYSYRDVKVGFGMPFTDMNDQTAMRGFSFAVNGKVDLMGFASQDYDLYRVGEFDTEKGVIEPCNPPVFLVSGASVKTES